MNQVPFTNTKSHSVNVDGKLIPPGETRMVDAARITSGQRKEVADRIAALAPKPDHKPEDPLLKLLDLSVAKLREAITDPEKISNADLDALETAERAGNTRKTAIEAIQEERLKRASGNDDPPPGDVNLGELLDGDESQVLLNIEQLKKAVEAGAGLTQEAIDQLLHSEEHGQNRQAVTDAICELEPKEATDSEAGKGFFGSFFGKKD